MASVAGTMDVDRLMTRLNPAIVWVLRSRLHWLLSGGLAVLEVTGRRTGRRYAIPVGYQRAGDTLTVLVSRAPRKQWWRNYRIPAPVEVWLHGHRRHGRAQVVAAGAAAFTAAFERTFDRLPALAGQFGIAYRRGAALTAEQRATLAANGAVVTITLS